MSEDSAPDFRRRALLVTAAALVVAGLLAMWLMQRTRPGPPLPRLGGVPAFVLYDQDGVPFPSSKLDGSVWLADFFFTRCRTICPTLTRRMSWFQKRLEGRPGWRLISITVDPAHDPPGVLTEYASEHGADLERWSFLTGEPALVKNVVTLGFRLGVDEDTTLVSEPFLHSQSIVLVDSDGEIRGYYDSSRDDEMKTLLRDVHRLLEERP